MLNPIRSLLSLRLLLCSVYARAHQIGTVVVAAAAASNLALLAASSSDAASVLTSSKVAWLKIKSKFLISCVMPEETNKYLLNGPSPVLWCSRPRSGWSWWCRWRRAAHRPLKDTLDRELEKGAHRGRGRRLLRHQALLAHGRFTFDFHIKFYENPSFQYGKFHMFPCWAIELSFSSSSSSTLMFASSSSSSSAAFLSIEVRLREPGLCCFVFGGGEEVIIAVVVVVGIGGKTDDDWG